jgi:protoporphyrin/coproporphyrin ferrochelatase
MTGILLVNMGGPGSPEELRKFLKLMFLDRHIIPAPYIIRSLLSKYISGTRYKKSWKRYKAIGGTPIIKSTRALAEILQEELGSSYKVKIAFSYSEPYISDSMASFVEEGITRVIAIPLYPHASFKTTSSVIFDIKNSQEKYQGLHTRVVFEFFDNPHFISFWTCCLMKHIRDMKIKEPFLLFSTHSIPISCIKRGDTYKQSVEGSAKMIAHSIGLEFAISYQSQMNQKKWLGPDTMVTLRRLAAEGKKEIVIVPFSFVSENLETLYDLDKIIIPESHKEIGTGISRVMIPEYDPLFIEMLKDLVNDFNY